MLKWGKCFKEARACQGQLTSGVGGRNQPFALECEDHWYLVRLSFVGWFTEIGEGEKKFWEQVDFDVDIFNPLLGGLRRAEQIRESTFSFSASHEQSSTGKASPSSSYSSKQWALPELLLPTNMLNKRNSSLFNRCLHYNLFAAPPSAALPLCCHSRSIVQVKTGSLPVGEMSGGRLEPIHAVWWKAKTEGACEVA